MTFEIGHMYYTKKGERVELQSITTNGKYVVAQELEFDDGDSIGYASGPSYLVGELFKQAPRAMVDDELTRLNEEAANLRTEISRLKKEVLDVERESAERLKKLSAYKGLEHLEDFVEGRITHLLGESYDDINILPISHINKLDSGGWGGQIRNDGVKLVSLFGDSKRDLTWKVNQYRDGSGSNWQTILPCMGEEEAERKRKEWIATKLDNAEKLNEYGVVKYVKLALKYGVFIPEAILEEYNCTLRQRKSERRERLIKNIADAQAELDAMASEETEA
jgi:hypothetical protein